MASGMEGIPDQSAPAVPPRAFGGRFLATATRKESHGTVTWSGVEVATDAPVIIKAVHVADTQSSLARRLDHEARILSRMESPHVVPLLHHGCEGAFHFVVMPLLPGDTLATRLEAGPLPVLDVLELALGVLTGLEDLHEQGLLHRDLKPSNVMVQGASVTPKVTLIDVGVARVDALDLSQNVLPMGTARYLSPEQAGFVDREVGPPSDLYALGVMLFECLAGRPPFVGATAFEVLRHHLVTPPPELRALGVPVPRAADEVVHRLLRKDPRDRYQSAQAVRRDVEAIRRLLKAGHAEPDVVVGCGDVRVTLTEPSFIGRTAELAVLDDELEKTRRGGSRLVRVEAPSGGGKSRILDEWTQRCRQRGALVLRGQGVSQSAARPFQMLVAFAEALVALVRLTPGLGPQITAKVGEARAAISAVLPELRGVLAGPEGTPGPEDHGETRTLAALASLLDALGTANAPAVIVLDDCQWADEMTVRLLAHWRALGTRSHVAVVLAFRTDEVPPRHPLRELAATTDVSLRAFGPADVDRIAESAAGPLPDVARAVVWELSEGSPFMVSAVLGGLVETGALVRAADATGERRECWQVNMDHLATVQSSRRAAVLLTRRVELLPAKTRRLLTNGAVLGKEFDLDLAGVLASLSGEETLEAHEDARRRHLVWLRPNSSSSVFVHDKIREALLSGLSEEDRRNLHRRAAAELERSEPHRVYDLAYHFDSAGDLDRALPYALKAGELARAQHALELAERQYRIAERSDVKDSKVRGRVVEGLGDVLMLRGRYEEAERYFEEAQTLAVEALSRAKLEAKRGELAFKRGEVQQATVSLERGMRLLGRHVPRRVLPLLVMLTWEVLVAALHTLFPRWFLARRSLAEPGAEEEFQAIRLYSRMAYAYWFHRGKLACLWAHLREMNLAERYPPTPELAQAYSEHAPVMTMIPHFGRGIDYAERSMVIRRALEDVWGQGQSLHFLGIVLYAAARFEDAREKCAEAASLLRRTGDLWEAHTAEWHIAFCEYRLGNVAEAVRLSREVHRSGQSVGDPQATGISLGCWAKAAGGRVPEDLLQAELQRGSDDVHTFAEVLQAEALRLLGEGRAEDAVRALERADRLIRARGLQQEYVTPVVPFLAGALRAQASDPRLEFAPRVRRVLLAKAEATARRARRLAVLYPNNLPHALRESGLIAALRGRSREARRFFDQSLDAAERQKMRLERVTTLEARAEVGRANGWSDAEADGRAAEVARRALEEEGAMPRGAFASAPGVTPTPATTEVVSLSLADRFPKVLDAGRSIAAALSRDGVLEAVRDSALALLRGERCVVREVSADATEDVAVGLSGGTLSATVVRRALSTGRVVVMSEGLPESDTDSLVLSGARSTLCAPILVRGRAAAYFYVTHEEMGALFGAAEERLAEFIAAIAGAALENAEGFAAVESLSEERGRLYLEAQEALGIRDDFLSVASHELRTPLTALQLAVQLLLRDLQKAVEHRDDPAVTASLAKAGKIDGQARRLAKLIDSLLDISRITHNRMDLEPERLDLRDVVREIVEQLGDPAAQARCVLRLQAPTAAPGVWDRARIGQIVTNLCTNAIKFGAGKPVDVIVARDDERGRVRLTVKDQGIGISTENQGRIFDRFERAVSARHYGGFGLGLWIVRQIVEAMGGTISVDSSPGGGSSFHVELPGEGNARQTLH